MGEVFISANESIVQPKVVNGPIVRRRLLVRLAKAHGVPLRQSYVRVSPRLLFKNNRFGHARQLRRQRRTTAKLKIVLGRVYPSLCS